MKNFKNPRGTIILVLCVAIILIGYYWVSQRGEKNREEAEILTPVQNVLLRDLERNYPPSPKEVVKYFSEITQCFYNEEYTDEELEQLAMKIKELYDDELAANKDDETYLADLRSDIAAFKSTDSTISSFTTSVSTDVDYFSEGGYECARLYCTYSIRTGTVIQSSEHIFVLRKDDEGHWKIYGWDLVDEDMPVQ